MDNVQFDENNYGQSQYAVRSSEAKESGFANWLIRFGLAKDISSANVLMTISALVVLAISIYFFMFGFSKPTFFGPQQPMPEEIPGLST